MSPNPLFKPTDRGSLEGFIDFLLCRAIRPSKEIADEKRALLHEATPLLGVPKRPDGTASGLCLPSTRLVATSFPMHCGSPENDMMQAIMPTYTGISVTTDEDVYVLLNAVTRGKLPLVKQRPSKDQQMGLVQSGYCFVFDETQSKIMRWTDSRRWGQKKVHGKFTVCSEIGTIDTGSRFMKHTYRVERDKSYYHVIAYSQEHARLTPASKDARLLRLASGADEREFSAQVDGGTTDANVNMAHPSLYPNGPSGHADVHSWESHNPVVANANKYMGAFPQKTPYPSLYNMQASPIQRDHTLPGSSHHNPEYFHVFLEACPHPWAIPAHLTDSRQLYLQRFFARVASLHASPGQTCFAATETFAFDYEGTPSVLAFLTVLREPFDIYRPSQNVDGAIKCRTELVFNFTILPISKLNTSDEPFTWLAIQTLGSHFQCERLKRAAWALGQLPPGSHALDSASFKWVRQTWTREQLRSGSRHVVDLVPGDDRQQWPLLRNLKTRLYHPANLALNSELMAVLDEDLRRACRESLQEWCIALACQLSHTPSNAATLCYAYTDYMMQATDLQINSFSETGYADALHTCLRNPCDHTAPSFANIKMELHRVLQSLAESLVQSSLHGQSIQYAWLDSTQQQLANTLGEQCYWLTGSYILLSLAERLHYDSLCRTGLNTLRAELTEKVGLAHVLIWNYLPDPIQAWAAKQRELMETAFY